MVLPALSSPLDTRQNPATLLGRLVLTVAAEFAHDELPNQIILITPLRGETGERHSLQKKLLSGVTILTSFSKLSWV